MTWSPDQYAKFAGPRLQPAVDLLVRIPLAAPRLVYDLGCGPGNVTRLLRERWPEAAITGVDNSASMLERARALTERIVWRQQDIADWVPEQPADVIFSNAALQWLPQHAQLFPRLLNSLAPGGILAVQMPRNFSAASHALIAETVRGGRWSATLTPHLRAEPVGDPRFYYSLLAPDTQALDIRETEYLHVLHGPDPIKEWTKGTWLAALLERLEPADRQAFEEDYAQRLRQAYPPLADGTTLFPFRRLFIVATRR